MSFRHSDGEERLDPATARAFLQVHAEREARAQMPPPDAPTVADLAESLHLSREETEAILREARARVAGETAVENVDRSTLWINGFLAVLAFVLVVTGATLMIAKGMAGATSPLVAPAFPAPSPPAFVYPSVAPVVTNVDRLADGFEVSVAVAESTVTEPGTPPGYGTSYREADPASARAIRARLTYRIVDLVKTNDGTPGFVHARVLNVGLRVGGGKTTTLRVPVPAYAFPLGQPGGGGGAVAFGGGHPGSGLAGDRGGDAGIAPFCGNVRRRRASKRAVRPLPWIETRPGLPYFVTEDGEAWTPIGANEAVTWPELAGLFRRRDLPGVEAHLRGLRDEGVTVMRLMLEYAQGEHRYLEKPVGTFAPNMVRLWDDLVAMAERTGMRLLLTPYDTFFMWTRWGRHPLNRRNGGPCASRRRWLTCPATREAIRGRLAFASGRWGGSPAVFAWDLWNEMHPEHAGGDAGAFGPFIDDLGPWLRKFERARHGRAHPQTVSIFGPELVKHPATVEPIFRHSALDFANTHLYEFPAIDRPKGTASAALAVGRLMREAVGEASDGRPVFDSEHGPIHLFKDRKVTLPEAFDDEYFRFMQWAHVASGGAGGGMRWPNRHPHTLTPGMRAAQGALARFLPLVDWTTFRRRNLNAEIGTSDAGVAAFGCGDGSQAVVWLLRTDSGARSGTASVEIPGLEPGHYGVAFFDTLRGEANGERVAACEGSLRLETPPFGSDLALVARRIGAG